MTLRIPQNCHVKKSEYSSRSRIQGKVFLNDQSAEQETSADTNDFNHSSKDYVNFISTYLSAQLMSTQNDDQNSGR